MIIHFYTYFQRIQNYGGSPFNQKESTIIQMIDAPICYCLVWPNRLFLPTHVLFVCYLKILLMHLPILFHLFAPTVVMIIRLKVVSIYNITNTLDWYLIGLEQLMILCRVQTLNLHLMLCLTISWNRQKKIRKYLNNLCMNKQYNTTPYDANSPKHVKNGTVFFFVCVKIVFSFLIKIIVRNF